MARAIVVGGGISGLAAARVLSRAEGGHRVTLLERSGRTGGKISTAERDGFVIEEGPDSFLTRKPAGVELCRELRIDGRFIGRTKRGHGSYLYRDGRLHPLPEGFSGLVPSDPAALEATTLLSSEAKARLLREREVPPAAEIDAEESVASFMTRRFGREAFEAMIEPLVSGIFAGDASHLSMQSAFPQLAALERRRGYVSSEPAASTRAPQASSLPPFVSFPRGLGELVSAATGSLEGVRLLTDSEVRSLRRANGGIEVELADASRERADAVVLAVPPSAAAGLIDRHATALAQPLASVEYASTVIVSLGFRQAELPVGLDGYGYLSPQAAHRVFHACTWSSSKWAHRAPEGFALIRLYGGRFGEDRIDSIDDDGLQAEARAELSHTLGIDTPPTLVHIRRWPQAIPQYNIGFASIRRSIEDALAETPGLFLAGAAYGGGVGIPDCIDSGCTAARSALEHLRRTGR